MKQRYLHIVFFLLTWMPNPVLTAQGDRLTLDGNISWSPSRQGMPGEILLDFEGAVNHDDFGLLPLLRIALPSEESMEYSGAVLTDCRFQPLDILDPVSYPDIDKIGTSPVVFTEKQVHNKKHSYSLCLLPLRRSPENGGYEKLVSFRAEVIKAPQRLPLSGNGKRTFADHSVLRSGEWYRISVKETGIYRITYSDLQVMGIDPSGLDPRNIRLFGNGNGMLEEAVALPVRDDLMENSIIVIGEGDGTFDPEDYILFYGEDPVQISYNPFYLKFEHKINYYSDETCYFLTFGNVPGKRVQPAADLPEDPTHVVRSFEDLRYHEKDELNLIKSGQVWYGEVFNAQLDYDFPFEIPHLDVSEPVYLKVGLAGRSTQSTQFYIYADGQEVVALDVPSIVLGSSIYARILTSNYEEFYAMGEQVNIGVTFVKPGTTDMGWLNYIELNCIRNLFFDGGQLSFRDTRPTGPGNIALYEIQSSYTELDVWNVSDISDVRSMHTDHSGGVCRFKDRADSLKEYIAFDNSQFLSPDFVGKVANQDLHSLQPADYVIVTHPDFMEQAARLADFHRQRDGMSIIIVTPQQIYNEFSSGSQDVTAIRNFMKMLYDRKPEGAPPGYLLLFGDASYDFKGILPEDHNLVPAYQSRESLKMAASFVTDDYFGCLDEDEGGNGSGTVDIGIGRFPVHTLEQAEQAVDKVLKYTGRSVENYGTWRNSICFVGDDEDNNIHLNQAEGLTVIADSLGAAFNVTKVYLDAYAQLQTPSGTRYPDANQAIDQSVNDGSLLVNYTGHGGEIGWASERVLDIPAIQAYRNIDRMAAFVTATCEFSRYDDPGLISAGELVFLNPEGAGIGLFTTTRLAYSQSNYTLNKRFYYEAFRIDSLTGQYPRMGDLIRVSKTPSNQNIKNFVLLGDPALMLAYPKMRVTTVNVFNENAGRPADTLYALSKVTITGRVEDLQGNLLEDFNGMVYPSVYDKPVVYKTRGNDPTSKVTDFTVQDKLLFRGETSVVSGEFSFTFVVPKDISYPFGEGKVSYYAVDTLSYLDASGYGRLIIGGSDSLGPADEQGPDIQLFLNHFEFQSGDVTTPDPLLIAKLYDENGINATGNGIGHDIVAVIDGDYMQSVVLNDYFKPVTDNYKEGEIRFPLGPFEKGTHTLTLKAWDVLNNSSEMTIGFQVNTGDRLSITGVQVQPNPLKDMTRFVFNHNKPGVGMDVLIRIYGIMGQPVHQMEYSFNTESLKSVPYLWDGRNSSGDELPSGLYVYILRIWSEDGNFAEASQKFLICR